MYIKVKTPSLFTQFYPVDKGQPAAHDLHRPPPQPEAQRPAEVSDEGREGELRDVGLSHCHLGVDVQSKGGGMLQNAIIGWEGSHRLLGDKRVEASN